MLNIRVYAYVKHGLNSELLIPWVGLNTVLAADVHAGYTLELTLFSGKKYKPVNTLHQR